MTRKRGAEGEEERERERECCAGFKSTTREHVLRARAACLCRLAASELARASASSSLQCCCTLGAHTPRAHTPRAHTPRAHTPRAHAP
eukprot:291687-Rhodomonas_salina.1